MKKQRLSKLRAAILGVVAVLVAGLFVLPSATNASTPDVPYVPTVVAPAHGVETVDTKPLITGVTQNDTEVAVYIDGAFNGKATVVNDASGTANWYYYPFLDLVPGWHTLQTRAENPVSGLRSDASELTKFKVVDPNAPEVVEAVKPYVPTLVLPVHGLVTDEMRPVVTGVVQNGMLVTVYVDGVFHGNATVTDHESGTGSFAYVPTRDLEAGWHKIMVRAEDPDTAMYSDWSEMHKVKVLAPTPAPTLLTPVVNEDTTWEKPWIIGYTHKGTEVAVYIDGEFNGMATLEVIEGKEVLHFTYKPFLDLSAGWHKVWVTARDASGKVSEQSATTWFTVTDPDAPVVVVEDDATEEEGDDIGGPGDEEEEETSDEASEEESEEGSEEDVYVDGESTDEESEEGSEEGEEGSDDEEMVDGEETDEEAVDGEEEEDGEKKTSRSTLIGWIILAAVAIALVWRGRKGMKSFFNEPELGGVDTIKPKKDDKPADKPKKDEKPKDKPKSDKGGKKDSKKTPPPPPPASSF